jgi:small-conductance mechanosensitive channel
VPAFDPTSIEDWTDAVLGRPLQVTVIVLVAVVLRWLLHRIIQRAAERLATGGGLEALEGRLPAATAILGASPLLTHRREQRARTAASVLKSLTTAVIVTMASLMVIDLVGDITPLLAGAGIVGVAIGFGAQSIVKDVISGIFMIFEDQYGVGDIVDVGPATGTIEAVGLRVTRLRDVAGTVWYVRNGEILRVGNTSQAWARAVIDVPLAYSADLVKAQQLMLEEAGKLREEQEFSALIIDEPELWGVEAFTNEAVVVRLVVTTQPLQQWAVARALRTRIKDRFDAEQIELR